MRDTNGKYIKVAGPVGGGYIYGDLVCLGGEVAVILVRGRCGGAFFLSVNRCDIIIKQ
jgi:hypothetical protein